MPPKTTKEKFDSKKFKISIETITADNLEHLANEVIDIFMESISQYPEDGAYARPYMSMENVKKMLSLPTCILAMAYDPSGRAVGFAAADAPEPSNIDIWGTFVRKDFQGKRIIEGLMEKSVEIFKALGYVSFSISARSLAPEGQNKSFADKIREKYKGKIVIDLPADEEEKFGPRQKFLIKLTNKKIQKPKESFDISETFYTGDGSEEVV